MKTFLICPVSNFPVEETQKYAKSLENDGWEVYWLPRDANQKDEYGFRICSDNLDKITKTDRRKIFSEYGDGME